MTELRPTGLPSYGLRPAPSATRPRDERPGVAGLLPEELAAWFTAHGQPAYRARQVQDAAWRGRQASFDEILTLPAALRPELDAALRFDTLAETEVRVTDGGLTEKALHRLSDGLLVESVLMHYPARGGSRERHTLCISSQAGCAVGLPVLRHGRAGHGAGPGDGGDRGPGASCRTASRRGRAAPHERRVHGHGRAAAQPRPRPRGDRRAQRPATLRARRTPHRGVHVGRGARDPAADRARAAVHAGHQPPRRAQRAARRPGAAQPALAGGGGGGGRARARQRRPAAGSPTR